MHKNVSLKKKLVSLSFLLISEFKIKKLLSSNFYFFSIVSETSFACYIHLIHPIFLQLLVKYNRILDACQIHLSNLCNLKCF